MNGPTPTPPWSCLPATARPGPGAADSRAATDELLAGLRRGRWRPAAWGRFLAHASRRSLDQARTHPYAVLELTALHLALHTVATRRGWVRASFALALTHLGMLEARRHLGLPNTVTLIRANLPALDERVPPQHLRWLGLGALLTDVLDGRLARATGTRTHFGTYADALADAAFWLSFARRHEPSPLLRRAAAAAWALPVAAVTAVSVRRGRMTDHPRPVLLRPAAALQAVLAVRALRRRSSS